MAACETCTSALGIVTNISTGKTPMVTTAVCPECKGWGTICGRCLKNYDRCRCPDPDEPKPRKKESWE